MSQDDLSDEDDDDEPASQDISSTSSRKSNFASLHSQGGFIEGTPIFPADQRDDSRYFGKIGSTAHVISSCWD